MIGSLPDAHPEQLPLWMQAVNHRLAALEIMHKAPLSEEVVLIPAVDGGTPVVAKALRKCAVTKRWLMEFMDGRLELVDGVLVESARALRKATLEKLGVRA